MMTGFSGIRRRLHRAAFFLWLVLLLCTNPASAELLRDESEILRILLHGRVLLTPDVAKQFPQSESQLQIRRIGLELDGRRIRAAFRDKSRRVPPSRELRVRYLDAYYNELAAYAVATQLGLQMVPVTVLRKIGITETGLTASDSLREGSLQLWVENAVVEYDLRDRGRDYPGDPVTKNEQLSDIRVFDCIIGNTDRHAGNLLVDLNPRFPRDGVDDRSAPLLGKIWAIDHGKAFHKSARIGGCRLHQLARRPVSQVFMEGMRRWQLSAAREAMASAGLSARQIESLHLKVLTRRLEKIREKLEMRQRESGLSDGEFYSSGLWHRVR